MNGSPKYKRLRGHLIMISDWPISKIPNKCNFNIFDDQSVIIQKLKLKSKKVTKNCKTCNACYKTSDWIVNKSRIAWVGCSPAPSPAVQQISMIVIVTIIKISPAFIRGTLQTREASKELPYINDLESTNLINKILSADLNRMTENDNVTKTG